MSEYTAFLVNPNTGEKTHAQYIGSADYALERARAEYPELVVTAIGEGPSIEIRREQVEKYGRIFSNEDEKRSYIADQAVDAFLRTKRNALVETQHIRKLAGVPQPVDRIANMISEVVDDLTKKIHISLQGLTQHIQEEEKRQYLKEITVATGPVTPLEEKLVTLEAELSELKTEFNELMGETSCVN